MKLKRIISIILATALLSFSPVFAEDNTPERKRVKFDFKSAEAEEFVKSGFVIAEDPECSGGRMVNASGRNSSNTGKEAPDIPISFEASSDCVYAVYVRLKNTDINTSFFAGVDERACSVQYANGMTLDPADALNVWKWWRVNIPMRAGKHTVKIRSRVPGISIDKIIITNYPSYYPYGHGQELESTDLYAEKGKNGNPLYLNIAAPAYLPQAEHPRVYLNRSDVERAKRNSGLPEIRRCYNAIKYSAGGEPSKCIMPPLSNGATTNFKSGAGAYMEANAYLYLYDGDVEAGRKAIEGALNYVSSLDTVFTTDRLGASRNAVAEMQSVARVYDWCYDLTTDEEKKLIIENGLRILTCGEVGSPPLDIERAWHQSHWSEGELINVQFSFAIAIYDEYPEYYNVIGGYIFNDYVPVRNYIYENAGRNIIGTGYGRDIYEIRMALLIDKMGAKNIISDKFQYWFISEIYETCPNGYIFQDGDHGSYTGVASRVGESANLMAGFLYKNPFLIQDAYDTMSAGATILGGAILYMTLFDPGLTPADCSTLPLSFYSGDMSGSIVARTGWEKDITSNDMMVFMKTPENFVESHSHQDAGQFQIYYKGMLAQDTGNYYRTDSSHYRNYYSQTIAHNCMLIYNPENDSLRRYPQYKVFGGQNGPYNMDFKSYKSWKENSKVGEILGVDFGGDVNKPYHSYLKGDITGQYNGNADKYTRTFHFMNFFDETYPGALIVFDRVTANKAFKRTWLLHSQFEPELSEDKKTQIIRRNDGLYNGRLINNTLLPEKSSIEKVGGDGYEYYKNGKNYEDSKTDESGNWRVEISPSEKQDTDYFLNVLQVSDDNDEIKPLEVEKYDTPTHAGVRIKDRAVFLSKNDYRTARPVKISVNGEGSLIYAIDGLLEGTWRVSSGGKEILTAEATARGGMISFEAPAGEYSLSYASKVFTEKPLPIYETVVEKKPRKEGIQLQIRRSLNNTFENPMYRDGDKIMVPIKELAGKLNLSDAVTETEDGIRTVFLGKETLFKKGECPERNGVLYTDIGSLADALRLTTGYTAVTDTLHVDTLYMADKTKFVMPDDGRLRVAKVTAEYLNPHYGLDCSRRTYYAHTKIGAEILYELEKEEKLSQIGFEWSQGQIRKYNFEAWASTDGINYEKLLDTTSSGTTQDYEFYSFEPVKAKYIKIIGKGNTVNSNINFFDIQFR